MFSFVLSRYLFLQYWVVAKFHAFCTMVMIVVLSHCCGSTSSPTAHKVFYMQR